MSPATADSASCAIICQDHSRLMQSFQLPRINDLVSQLSQLNDHARLDRAARQMARDEAAKPKTIRDKFGDCVTDEALDEDLPKLHHELAAHTKC